MNYLPPLEELDTDGAIREGAESVDGSTRADFLRRAGLGAGTILGGSALLGAVPAIASAGVPRSDIAILNFALTLEYLESAFYAEAVSKGKLSGETAKFAKVVAAHERAHVAFLKGTLGAKAVKKPRFNFRDTTSDQAKFEATAKVLEDTGVAAYLGQVGNIRNKTVLEGSRFDPPSGGAPCLLDQGHHRQRQRAQPRRRMLSRGPRPRRRSSPP